MVISALRSCLPSLIQEDPKFDMKSMKHFETKSSVARFFLLFLFVFFSFFVFVLERLAISDKTCFQKAGAFKDWTIGPELLMIFRYELLVNTPTHQQVHVRHSLSENSAKSKKPK